MDKKQETDKQIAKEVVDNALKISKKSIKEPLSEKIFDDGKFLTVAFTKWKIQEAKKELKEFDFMKFFWDYRHFGIEDKINFDIGLEINKIFLNKFGRKLLE